MGRIFSIMLNKSGKSRHPCLIPDISRKKIFLSSSMMLAVGLLNMAFIMLKYVPSKPTLLRIFIINGC